MDRARQVSGVRQQRQLGPPRYGLRNGYPCHKASWPWCHSSENIFVYRACGCLERRARLIRVEGCGCLETGYFHGRSGGGSPLAVEGKKCSSGGGSGRGLVLSACAEASGQKAGRWLVFFHMCYPEREGLGEAAARGGARARTMESKSRHLSCIIHMLGSSQARLVGSWLGGWPGRGVCLEPGREGRREENGSE